MKNLWMLILLFFVGVVWADNHSSDEAQTRLNQLTSGYIDLHLFEASFIQTKQVKFMQKPLVSSGRIRFAKNHGLLWIIDKPFQSKTWVNQQGVFKANQFEDKKQVKDPQMKAVAGLLGDLLSAQIDQVAQKFSVVEDSTDIDTVWQVTLRPNTTLMKKVLQSIQVIGTDPDVENVQGIQRIVVTDSNQNVTEIEFNDIKRQHKPLTDQQISEF